MPLEERTVTPINLGRFPLELDRGDPRRNVHHAVASNALVGILHQLASVVRLADDIFCDITEECQKVFEKSERIGRKLAFVEGFVKDLDAKAVAIPVGDLSKFSHCQDHHVAKHGFDCDLFTPDNRPQCVKDQYMIIDRSPSKIMRGADLYRKDGLCTSRLFKLWPVVLNEHRVQSPDFNLPRRSQNVFTFEKKYKKLKERRKTIHITEELFNYEKSDIGKENKNKEKTMEDVEMIPSEIVKIDTSGTGFHRMESFRKVLSHIEYEDVKKKKRQRTTSSVSESILKEIEMFEKKRVSTSGRDNVRDYNFDDLDVTELEVVRDEEMAKYLDEIDAKMEERKEDEKLLKEPKIMKFFPCRRSKSLPRCAKINSAKALIHRKSITGELDGSELSLNSNGSGGSRQSRLSKRGSIIGNKIRSLVRSSSGNRLVEKIQRPRPKSLDLDAIDFDEPTKHSNLAKMPSMPDGMLSRQEMNLKVGPGSYYNFESESNTLPRRNIRRNEFPWESMPKDWTTSVKLREISKRHSSYTDRQSSSGHWSGSSSNRHSLDSDHVRQEIMPNSTSQCSLGNDSGRDSPIPPESRCGTESTGGYTGDDASTLAGDVNSVCNAKLDTETWLKSLAVRASGRDEVSSSSAETLSSLTRLTKKNIMALDLMMSSPQTKPSVFDDGESSVYSVDQEGFYTSFHNDSGLRKSSGTLVDDEEDLSISKDSQSLCSVESVIHNPDGQKYAGAKLSKDKVITKASPPAPPPRTTSLSSLSDHKTSPHDSSSFSDTDQETISTRLISKTQISKTSIPPLCPVFSDEDSPISRQTSNEDDQLEKHLQDGDFFQGFDVHDSVNCGINPSCVLNFEGKDNTTERSKEVGNSCQTLPRTFNSKGKDKQPYDYTRSWPRSHNKKSDESDQPISGILKSTDRSLSGPKTPKSLNFSPVINMFDPGTPLSVQLPLVSSPTSSEDDRKGKKIPSVAQDGEYRLTVQEESKDLPLKYQPTLVVKPGSRSQSAERKSQDPQVPSQRNNQSNVTKDDNLRSTTPYAICPIKGASVSNPNSQRQSSGYMDMQSISSFGSINSLESSESLTLSNSLTYVTMTSPCSSPNLSNLDVPMTDSLTGSFESLNDQSTLSESYHKPCSNTIDNSNLSTTMETVAITTNSSFGSFNDSSVQNENKSFQTFSNRPINTSTPHTSTSSMRSFTRNPNNSHSNLHLSGNSQNFERRGRSPYKSRPVKPEAERSIKTSKSFPQDMVQYTSTKYQERTKSYKASAPTTSKSRKGAVVNVMNIGLKNNEPEIQSNRSDSYRVAMGENSNCRSGSYRVAMKESLSCPSFQQKTCHPQRPNVSLNQMSPEIVSNDAYNSSLISNDVPLDFSRTDSYRVAVRNTHGVVNNDIVPRNSSYRVAVNDIEPVVMDSRMNGLDSGMQLASGRDSRRMGITNVDQLKGISNKKESKMIGGVDVSKIDTSKVIRRRPKSDIDPISVISDRDAVKYANKTHKNSSKRHSNSSTYIKFDPIFEVGEDMTMSMESLKTASNSSLKMTDNVPSMGYGFNHEAPKINAGSYSKSQSDKSSSSFLGSIKSTFKSMSSNSKVGQNEDDWRFSMV